MIDPTLGWKTPPILVATPYRKSTAPGFVRRSTELYESLTWPNKERAFYPNEIVTPPGSSKYFPNAVARNELLRIYLKPEHEYVFWIDVDIVECCSDMIEQLICVAYADGGSPDSYITAPLVLIEGTDTFYDFGGFTQGFKWISPTPPYFKGDNIVPLTSVGSCYLVPAWIYRAGAQFESLSDYQIEHASTMLFAMKRGVKIRACRSLIVQHAHLGHWHEGWH